MTSSAFITGWYAMRRVVGQARHLPGPLAHEQGHAARPRPDPGTAPPVPAVAARREMVGDLNRFLHGWAAYFKYGNSTRHFDKVRHYARMRLALLSANATVAAARLAGGW
jgi:Group II intron, maturase-specific domain